METLGRREQNKIDKRARLLAAARQLFQSEGLDATTAAISQAAGVGAGTFYLYFASKEDLVIEVFRDDIRRTWNDAFALVRTDDPIVEQIIGVFSGVTSVHERDAELARLWFREVPYASSEAKDAANDVVAWAQHRIEALLDAARGRAELDRDVDVAVLSRMCLDLWIALMIRRHSGGITASGAIERLASALRMTFRYMAPDQRPRQDANLRPAD
ncbi:MAG TPA: helix-turn-helix domain-containing protein [Acidimicrobiales bacterium]|nr:helix-turn-helix domain-containing protein [Acidimicrobiales bacterium]